MATDISKPLGLGPLYEQVYDAVKNLILTGGLRPGEAISEVKLAERLNVSRTPVREAVRRLVAESLMETPGRGMLRVYAPTIRDIAEVYYARACLEAAAAGLAASFADDAVIDRLEQLTDKLRGAAADGNLQEATEANSEFHATLVSASRNKRMIDILNGLNPAIVRYRRLSLMFPNHLQRSIAEHTEIVRLLREGTPDQVEDYLRAHVLRAGGRIVSAVADLEGSGEPDESGIVAHLIALSRDGA